MNYRPLASARLLQFSTSMLRLARHSLLLLLLALLLAACWGDDDPAAAEPAAEAPISALPTTAATASDTTAPASTTTDTTATPAGIAALATTPVTANTTTTNTEPVASPTPTFVPLEAEKGNDCEIESNLDLAGYPDLEQRMGCATELAIFDPIAINEFGPADQPTDRFMLWFSHEAQIYVLLPDGTYQPYEDTWNEETDPTYPCNPVGGEEDSPPLPRRGFGKLWCSSPELQEIMGTVPREERLCQHAVMQRFETGRLLACFEDATIRYFRILDDGTWDLQVQ